jgi:hypothetical protein
MPTWIAPRLPPPLKTNAVFAPTAAIGDGPSEHSLPTKSDGFEDKKIPDANTPN